MKYVMPIEDKKIISDIGDYLMGRNERDYVLFMTGIYLGRRISDILLNIIPLESHQFPASEPPGKSGT